jgi:hypothetical protein
MPKSLFKSRKISVKALPEQTARIIHQNASRKPAVCGSSDSALCVVCSTSVSRYNCRISEHGSSFPARTSVRRAKLIWKKHIFIHIHVYTASVGTRVFFAPDRASEKISRRRNLSRTIVKPLSKIFRARRPVYNVCWRNMQRCWKDAHACERV